MYEIKEFIWGNGDGVERTPRFKIIEEPKEKPKEKPKEPIEEPKFDVKKEVSEDMLKLDQYIKNSEAKNEYMKEKDFIGGFVRKNDRDVVNTRLSERRLFADGIKNPFMVDSDYSMDMDLATKYIKFGKK
jgi:hypothetical protein